MSGDLHEQYMNLKNDEVYDGESDIPYHRKHERCKPKKSDHKHKYRNVAVIDEETKTRLTLIGVCDICGKVGNVQTDKRIERKFPNVKYKSTFASYLEDSKDEYEEFVNWCKDNYDVFEVSYDDLCKLKYI